MIRPIAWFASASLALLLATACGSSEDESSGGKGGSAGSGGTTGGTSGASGTGGTSSGKGGSGGGAMGKANFTVNVSLSSAIQTVGIVEWSVDVPVDSAVIDFGRDANAFEYQAPTDLAEPNHRTLLLGMKPSTTYSLRVVAQGGGQTYTSNVVTVETGFLPNGLPVATIDEDSGAAALWAGGGFTVACTGYDTFADVGSNPSWVFIFDKDGDQVWALDVSSTSSQGCTRARMSLDGKYMWAGNFGNFSSSGALTRVSMDGTSAPENYELPGRSHDFAILPNGHIVYFARNNGGSGQSPESVRELDPETSQTTLIWDEATDFTFDMRGGHTNQVNFVPELNALSVSMLFINTVALVSYPGGDLISVFGGSDSTFQGMSWNGQHGHDVRGDHVSIFNNNGSNGGSSVLRFTYDRQASSAMALSDYSSGVDSVAFGDVKELPNGNYYVTYSSSSTIHELSSSLTMLRAIGINQLIGYTEHRATLYGPPPPFDR